MREYERVSKRTGQTDCKLSLESFDRRTGSKLMISYIGGLVSSVYGKRPNEGLLKFNGVLIDRRLIVTVDWVTYLYPQWDRTQIDGQNGAFFSFGNCPNFSGTFTKVYLCKVRRGLAFEHSMSITHYNVLNFFWIKFRFRVVRKLHVVIGNRPVIVFGSVDSLVCKFCRFYRLCSTE